MIMEPPERAAAPQFIDLVHATQFGRLDECKQILESGAFNVNQRDDENVTLLHWAAINNQTQIVDYYLGKGADVNAIGGDLKSTPLQWAVRQGHLQMVVMLMKRGADLNILDGDDGCNALHLAVQFGHTAIVAYLVAKGMSVDTPDASGMTPLMWSAYRITKVDPTRLLLTLGASIKMVDNKEKNTPLHWAVTANNLTAITLLLDAGADVSALNARDETPLDMARKYQSHWLIRMLEHHQRHTRKSNDSCSKITKNDRLRSFARYMAPFVAYYIMILILDSGASPMLKILYLILMFILIFIFNRINHQIVHDSNFAVAVYLAITFWLYYTLFVHLTPGKSYMRGAKLDHVMLVRMTN